MRSRTITLSSLALLMICQTAIAVSAEVPSDEPRLEYHSPTRTISGPPRDTSRKYVFTTMHLPDQAGNATKLQVYHAILDAGCFRYFATLNELREVTLPDTNLGDAELALLLALSDCETLNISGTNVTGVSVDLLVNEKSLKRVFISGTGISVQEARRLKQSRPDLEVYWGGAELGQSAQQRME